MRKMAEIKHKPKMMKLETTTAANDGAAAANSWARTCDSCRSAASALYCRADLAYLCTACDGRIHHGGGRHHERVWMCESCERAPAEFLCKADSASLCASCDAEIHSANPLARRHHRVPILPIHGPSAALTVPPPPHDELFRENGDDEDEAASWLLLNPMKTGDEEQSINGENGGLFGGEVDDYLDLEDYNHTNEGYNNQETHYSSIPQSSYGGDDSVVPIQYNPKGKDCFPMGLDYEASKPSGYGYHATLSHSVSLSSMDVGIVPESTTNEAISASNRPPKGTIDLFSSPPMQIPSQLTPLDREARVLRYREKKKNRKFEKTIRYASRKAYAETRPRIKGRFAKRTDKVEVEVEVDRLFSASALMAEENNAYGVVPSF